MKARSCILFVLLLLVSLLLNSSSIEGIRIQAKSNVTLAPKVPDGTAVTIQSDGGEVIPIRRHYGTRGIKKKNKMHGKLLSNNVNDDDVHQYAVVEYDAPTNELFHGAHATLNVWRPSLESQETAGRFSLTQIWVLAGPRDHLNTIEAGWMVGNGKGSEPKFFTYWTRDNYKDTGCYNDGCSGFNITDKGFSFDTPLPVSQYNGKQSEIDIDIYKDNKTGNWYLFLQGKEIGYWPPTIFTTLANAAHTIQWGGEVAFQPSTTTPQMGSGHFPREGLGKSSYVRGMFYKTDDGRNVPVDPTKLQSIISAQSCYDRKVDNIGSEVYLLYGGPGCRSS